jgi:hypothetical protein
VTREEFGRVIAYITAGTSKTLSPDSLEVYFDLLGDLRFEVLLAAAKRVMLEHPWATFPSVAELREAAVGALRGKISGLSPAEAWDKAWAAAARIDPEVEGSFDRAIAKTKVPPLVVEAMRAFGIYSLCCGQDPVSVMRGQFMKIYEQLAARDERLALMPPSVKQAIESVGKEPQKLPGKVAKAIESIGIGGR